MPTAVSTAPATASHKHSSKEGTLKKVVILGAGRNNTQAIIDYLRKTSGLQAKLAALAAEVEPEPATV